MIPVFLPTDIFYSFNINRLGCDFNYTGVVTFKPARLVPIACITELSNADINCFGVNFIVFPSYTISKGLNITSTELPPPVVLLFT